jgi:hypothetical protein
VALHGLNVIAEQQLQNKGSDDRLCVDVVTPEWADLLCPLLRLLVLGQVFGHNEGQQRFNNFLW